MAGSTRPLYRWLALAAALVVLSGAGVAWLMRGGPADRPKGEVAELESEAGTRTAEASETVESTPVVPPAEPVTQPVTAPVAEAPREEVTGPSETQPGYVHSVSNTGGSWSLTIDYAQFLTGGEAADAAAAHGDESPPPNDYYIVNDNPKLREFPIKAGISVTVVTNPDGGSDPAGHVIGLAEWAAAINGTHADIFRSNLYWLTVTNGVVTAVEAQYVP